jgi:hypothetical protein
MIQPVVPAENPLNSLLFLLITLNNFNFSKLRHCRCNFYFLTLYILPTNQRDCLRTNHFF